MIVAAATAPFVMATASSTSVVRSMEPFLGLIWNDLCRRVNRYLAKEKDVARLLKVQNCSGTLATPKQDSAERDRSGCGSFVSVISQSYDDTDHD